MNKILIQEFKESDVSAIARVHALAFSRQRDSRSWVECCARAHPRMRYFVARDEGTEAVHGFILWGEKSGFREEVVLELEQIAVVPEYQGKGIGELLIRSSLPVVADYIQKRGARLKAVLVTTRVDNYAQRLYRKTLGAEVEAVIENLFSADEVFMVARNPMDHC